MIAYAGAVAPEAIEATGLLSEDRRDVGLQLSIKPQISEGGTVRLAIYLEDSSVAAGSSADNPTLNKRSFQTNVLV